MIDILLKSWVTSLLSSYDQFGRDDIIAGGELGALVGFSGPPEAFGVGIRRQAWSPGLCSCSAFSISRLEANTSILKMDSRAGSAPGSSGRS